MITDPKYPFLVEPYSALASVYDRAGFADFARTMIPGFLAYAFSIDWAGRSVLDLGCGTGFTSWWLSDQGYRVGAIDNNPHMLAQARQRPDVAGVEPPDFAQADIRQFHSPIGTVDLVIAVGAVFNAIQSLRDLEAAFARVNQALDPGKLFIFDLHTIRGMAVGMDSRDTVDHDDGHSLMVVVRNQFSFETLTNTRHIIIHERDGTMWHRRDELHTRRGYPTQGIAALLDRVGFERVTVLTTDMEPISLQNDSHEHIVVVAHKPA